MSRNPFSRDRRDFLTGKVLTDRLAEGAQTLRSPPTAGHTVGLTTRAMACDFSVVLNAGASKRDLARASTALELISQIEGQISVYRDDSELTAINATAAERSVVAETGLFQLLTLAQQLSRQTKYAFDPTSGPLVTLWRSCRDADRIPGQEEIDACLARVGVDLIELTESTCGVRFSRAGSEINLGAIGKGYGLDRAGEVMDATVSPGETWGENEPAQGTTDWLLHGGRSSLLARGRHGSLEGWPVGIGNPLFQGQRLATILLRDCGMATSGSNTQFFRYRGQRYGHILDPRTGWPVDELLSVTVLAPTAAMADALSTAFYVMGVEKSREWCDNHQVVGAILVPPAVDGRKLRPVVVGIPDELLFWDPAQLSTMP